MFSFVSFAIVILNRKEFGSTIKLILIGALAFLASQAIKMLIFAMVFPAIDESAASFDPMQDALRKIVDLVDIFTARYALNYINSQTCSVGLRSGRCQIMSLWSNHVFMELLGAQGRSHAGAGKVLPQTVPTKLEAHICPKCLDLLKH